MTSGRILRRRGRRHGANIEWKESVTVGTKGCCRYTNE